MTDKANRKALLLSLALCLAAPATFTAACAEESAKPAAAAADSTADKKPAAPEETSGSKRHKDDLSEYQHRHQEDGYYSGVKGESQRQSDNQKRHSDEGYYSEVKPYVAPPPEVKPALPPPTQSALPGTPPPLVIPPVGSTPGGSKFEDDTGATGSITATRHAKQAQELFSSGHFDLAKHHYRESLAVMPNQLELYGNYWESCAKTNDWGEGRRALDKLFELDPAKKKEWAWAYGETWFQLRNYDKAVAALNDALKYGNHLEDVHNDILKIGLNRRDSALINQEYAALTKIKPNDYKMQLDYANWLEVAGKHGEAIGHYRSAANLNPGDGALAARLAYMLMYYNKDFKGAINFYTRAIAGDPLNAAKYQENIKYAQAQIQVDKPAPKKVQQ
ncbi:MAG TPA: tetratricopeptide repeat protein [Candidatus Obscuribacterales bacterium]